MSARMFIPYAGAPTRRDGSIIAKPVPLSQKLGPYSEDRALHLLRNGRDTVDIAWLLACTEAAAANGIARARDRELSR